MTEEEKRNHRVCFTGHRPEKLLRTQEEIRTELEICIRQAIQEGLTIFITGMAQGVDLWAAEIVLALRREGQPVKLVCAVPFEGCEKSWSPHWKETYRTVLREADLVHILCPGYTRFCYALRNRWMVDHAARLIAVSNGSKGGTQNTMAYARKKAVPIVYIKG